MSKIAAIPLKPSRAVFIAVWAHAMAVSIAAFAFFTVGAIFSNILFHRLRLEFPGIQSPPLPLVTQCYIHGCGWALLFPPAFLVAAFRLCQPLVFTSERLFAYSGISIATITFLISFASIALACPYMRWISNFDSPFWPG
ncbi:MAG: hypothetical protein V4710_21185 [Verrucomicrobiota bacterium]